MGAGEGEVEVDMGDMYGRRGMGDVGGSRYVVAGTDTGSLTSVIPHLPFIYGGDDGEAAHGISRGII